MANLCPIPWGWAVYFMDSKSPWDAIQMGRTLVATLENAAERARADPLLDWLKAAAQRVGAMSALERSTSIMNATLLPVVIIPKVVSWVKTRLAPYRLPTLNGVAPGTLPNELTDKTGGVPLNNRPAGEREYTPLEQERIQAACGLVDTQWETDLPELYPRMLEEGRKASKVKSLLEELFRATANNLTVSTRVRVTDEMARDIKELNFGFRGDLSQETCHRGISPFAVVSVTMKTAANRKRKLERLLRASLLTPGDIEAVETVPDPIPTNYMGLMDLLRRYLPYLMAVVGSQCSHARMVRDITQELANQEMALESIQPRQVASILWQIFIDAHFFFMAGVSQDGRLPGSRLDAVLREVGRGLVAAENNVPYGELMGPAAGLPLTTPHQPGAHGQGKEGKGNRVPTAPEEWPLSYTGVIPVAVKAALKGARTRFPNVTILDIMGAASPPLSYHQVKMGPGGSCMD